MTPSTDFALHLERTLATSRAFLRLLEPLTGDHDRDRLSADQTDALMSVVERIFAYVQPKLVGAEHLDGLDGALLVGNHGLMGVDSFGLYPLLWRATGRLPRGLGDRVLFTIEPIRRFVTHAGAIAGYRDAAVELLREDELVLVYPGGSGDSFKGDAGHYQLPWHGRTGFARVAMRAQKPVVPVMAAGIDDAYHFLFRDHWLFPRIFGHGKARYAFPVSVGMGLLPLPGSQFTYHICPPIQPPKGAHLADDEAAVAQFHAEVWQTCQAHLDAAVVDWRAGRAQAVAEAGPLSRGVSWLRQL